MNRSTYKTLNCCLTVDHLNDDILIDPKNGSDARDLSNEKWMSRKIYVHNNDTFVSVVDDGGNRMNIVTGCIESARMLGPKMA